MPITLIINIWVWRVFGFWLKLSWGAGVQIWNFIFVHLSYLGETSGWNFSPPSYWIILSLPHASLSSINNLIDLFCLLICVGSVSEAFPWRFVELPWSSNKLPLCQKGIQSEQNGRPLCDFAFAYIKEEHISRKPGSQERFWIFRFWVLEGSADLSI